MAIIKIQKVFMKKLVVLFTLLHFGVAGEPDDGILKSETKLGNNSSAKIASQLNDFSARRYHYINNRDSYVNAANSFSNGGGGQMGFSQNSYDAPMQQQGGYGWTDLDDSSQSSKGGGIDLLGLVGLIGLKGLTGTLPLIKKISLILIALSPVLIPLSIFKLIIIFLKPVITFGRDINSGSGSTTGTLMNLLDSFADKWNIDETKSTIDKMSENVLSRGSDDRCMERIACEGLFKSIPRIFMKILGDNFKPTVLRKQRSTENKDDENGRQNEPPNSDPRRKDLATLALNKLKNRQNFAKKPSSSETPTRVGNACQQYKCSTLF